jgi:hypothetical protein
MLIKSSPPLPDDLGAHVQARRDLGVGHALGGVQDNPRALHIPISQRQLRRTRLKHTPLLIRQSDVDRSRHHTQNSPTAL